MAEGIGLGDVAKDKLTGFTGVVVAVTKWLHGCKRLMLQPQELKDGKPIEPISFDLPQLLLVSKAVLAGSADTGGPTPEPQRRSTPSR